MNNIDIARSAIGEIDRQLSSLFQRRLDAIEMIADECISEPEALASALLCPDRLSAESFDSDTYELLSRFFEGVDNISSDYAFRLKNIIRNTLIDKENDSIIVPVKNGIDAKAEKSIEKTTSVLPSHLPPDAPSVIIKRGITNEAEAIMVPDKNVLIISDSESFDDLIDSISKISNRCLTITTEAPSQSRSGDRLQRILAQLSDAGFNDCDMIVSIGNELSSNLALEIAEYYSKALEVIIIPTTLYSCIYCPIDGKKYYRESGYYIASATFNPVKKIIIDVDLISFFDENELLYGIIEAIKIGLAYDEGLFSLIQEKGKYIYSDINRIIELCIENRKKIMKKPNEYQKGFYLGEAIADCIYRSHNIPLVDCRAIGILKSASPAIQSVLIDLYDDFGFDYNALIDANELCLVQIDDKYLNDGKAELVFCDKAGSFTPETMSIDDFDGFLYGEFS